MSTETTQGVAGSNGGSILTRKTGPLANWIWMAILLLVALVFSMWKRNKSAPDANANTDDTADSTLTNQNPPPVFILPQNPQPTVPINITIPPATQPPPTTPPGAPPVGTKPPSTNPPPVPKPVPKPSAPAYDKVTVTAYTKTNTRWDSTLWGIAQHYGYGNAGNNYLAIINDPRNAALKTQIKGDPHKLPKGATVWVRKR